MFKRRGSVRERITTFRILVSDLELSSASTELLEREKVKLINEESWKVVFFFLPKANLNSNMDVHLKCIFYLFFVKQKLSYNKKDNNDV